MNDSAFLRIVALIYDAAASPESWPRALDAVTEAFDAVATHLCLWERDSGNLIFSAASGTEIGAGRCQMPSWDRCFPDMGSGRETTDRSIRSCEEEFGPEAPRRCRVFDAAVAAAPGPGVAALRLLDDDGFSAVVKLGRRTSANEFGTNELAALDRLKPHLQRAIRLQYQLTAAHGQRRLLAAAQDHLPFGVIVANAAGSLVFANHSADKVFGLADGLTRHHGVIGASRSDETATLLRMIAEAASGTGAACGMVRISRPSRKASYALLVAPLHAGRSRDRHPPPLALIVCTDPAQYPQPSTKQLAQVFGLTAAEARLATGLAGGKRLEDISVEAGVSKTTLRTQLRAVMDKTETNRQADLIRLILSLPTVR